MSHTLIDHIERATGPDRELDAEIAAFCRCFPKSVGSVWRHSLKANSPDLGRVECCTKLGTGGPHYEAPAYTASIDAALSLMPEGWRLECLENYRASGLWEAGICIYPSEGSQHRKFASGVSATAPLAILSAIMKARSL